MSIDKSLHDRSYKFREWENTIMIFTMLGMAHDEIHSCEMDVQTVRVTPQEITIE